MMHNNNLFQNKGTIRSFVSPSILGIGDFQRNNSNARRNIKLATFEEDTISSFKCADSVCHFDDVRKVIAVCEKNKQHLKLAIEVLERYYDDCKLLEIEPEKCGPMFARLLYVLRETDLALKVLASEMNKYFSQYTTYLVVFDLLYEEGRLTDIMKLMTKIQKDHILNNPRHCLTIACASAYKTNTDESLKSSCDWVKAVEDNEVKPNLRSLSLVSALAIRRKKANVCKTILAKIGRIHTLPINNIFLLCACYLSYFDDVLNAIRASIQMHKLGKSQPILTFDVVEEMESLIRATGNNSLITDFVTLKQLLGNCQLISNQNLKQLHAKWKNHLICKSLEQLLFEPITDLFKEDPKRLNRRELQQLMSEDEV